MKHVIKCEFEVSEEYIDHLKRIKKEYGFGPQQFLDEVIYSYQIKCWDHVKSITIDTELQDRPVCYITNKNKD